MQQLGGVRTVAAQVYEPLSLCDRLRRPFFESPVRNTRFTWSNLRLDRIHDTLSGGAQPGSLQHRKGGEASKHQLEPCVHD